MDAENILLEYHFFLFVGKKHEKINLLLRGLAAKSGAW